MEHLRLPVAGHLVAWMGRALGRAVLEAGWLQVLRVGRCNSHMLAAWGRREVLLARLSGKTSRRLAALASITLPSLANRLVQPRSPSGVGARSPVRLALGAPLVGYAIVGDGVLGDVGNCSLVRDAGALLAMLI